MREGITVSIAHEIVPGLDPRASAAFSSSYGLGRYDPDVTWGYDSTVVMFHWRAGRDGNPSVDEAAVLPLAR